MGLPKFTIGIEEEYQIIHPQTRELTTYIQEFLDQGRVVLGDQIKAELLQSQVEVGSQICRDIQEARAEVVRLRSHVCELAESNGLRVVAASTHPFSTWAQQEMSAGERYSKLAQDLGDRHFVRMQSDIRTRPQHARHTDARLITPRQQRGA